MNQKKNKVVNFFDQDGPLAGVIFGYSPRDVQIEMALAVETALEQQQLLIAEAGTGTGKTFAYLIPSLLSGKKIIISTGTKNLQDQLFKRDLPLIRKLLGIPLKIALLKGRSNYLCLHRLNTYAHQSNLLSPSLFLQIQQMNDWAQFTSDGEVDQLADAGENAIWPYVTSTSDNCLGQECAFFQDCFLFKVRRISQEADILIINHHLFFADLALRDTGFGELLPNVDAVIFDEAHQLPEIATHFLGEFISSRQLYYLAKDIQVEIKLSAPELIDISLLTEKLLQSIKEIRAAFGKRLKGAWETIRYKPQFNDAVVNLQNILEKLQNSLNHASERGIGLQNCFRRLLEIQQKLKLLLFNDSEDLIHWFEVYNETFSIHLTPLSVAYYFRNLIDQERRTWIFTSATLSINGNFNHFQKELGIECDETLFLKSPFDYSRQALLYLPSNMPDTQSDNYTKAVVDVSLPILKKIQGRTFLLFTSHKALKEVADLLSGLVDFPLLVQGTNSKTKLLAEFCRLDNAILLGTNSFWEGVDVRGEKLSCVIIDKIPFATPEDPVMKARLEYLKKQGTDAFSNYQLPRAIIALRQGAGRLIRGSEDKGVLVICDPRLISKNYGKLVLDSLPPMSLTQNLQDVLNFFE